MPTFVILERYIDHLTNKDQFDVYIVITSFFDFISALTVKYITKRFIMEYDPYIGKFRRHNIIIQHVIQQIVYFYFKAINCLFHYRKTHCLIR